jgi:hypothetical protein
MRDKAHRPTNSHMNCSAALCERLKGKTNQVIRRHRGFAVLILVCILQNMLWLKKLHIYMAMRRMTHFGNLVVLRIAWLVVDCITKKPETVTRRRCIWKVYSVPIMLPWILYIKIIYLSHILYGPLTSVTKRKEESTSILNQICKKTIHTKEGQSMWEILDMT